MGDADIIKMILQGASMGGAFAPQPYGAMVSGAANIASAGIDLANKPEFIGPSAGELEAEFFAGETAKEAMMTPGVSAQDISRFVQAGNETESKATQEMNTMFRGISPFDMARISNELISRASKTRDQTMEGVSKYLKGSAASDLLAKTQTTRAYGDLATRVREAKLKKQLLEFNAENKMNEDFTKMIIGVSKAMAAPVLDDAGNPYTEEGPGVSGGDVKITQPLQNKTQPVQPVVGQPADENALLAAMLRRRGFPEEMIAHYTSPDRTKGFVESLLPTWGI